MKGFIFRTLTFVGMAGAAGVGAGCYHHHDLIDPCYPERYELMARREVNEVMAPQVHNGHILDQTVWNYHFEFNEEKKIGTDRLTAGGMEHLAYLARRRPCPDPTVFLQTAQDVPYDPAVPEKFVEERCHLDGQRMLAVQKYLNAITAGHNIAFNVVVHDPPEVGMSAVAARGSVVILQGSAQGVLAAGGRGSSGSSTTATVSSTTSSGASGGGGGTATATSGGR